MRVCIDVQSAIVQRAGVGRYTRMLVEHLGADAGDDEVRLFYFDFRRRGTPWHVPFATHRAIRWCPGRLPQAAWKALHWPPFDWLAGPAAVYHFPNFVRPPLRRGRSVVTVHDLSFLRHPEFAEERNCRYLTATIRDTVANADAIVTDSAFSASEIETLLHVDRSRLFAIHLGIGPEFKPQPEPSVQAVRTAFGLTRPYVLCVGTLEPRKNLPFLFDVFEQLRDFDGDLVVAGRLGWKVDPILERMRTSARAVHIRHLANVTDEELPGLYAGAELLVLTSRYEGFGLPPLEAMACGTPVVSAAQGSLPEVLGGAAVLVKGFEVEEWAAAVCRALTDSALRTQLVAEGRRHATTFTWARTARETWRVYRGVAGEVAP